MSKDRVIDSLGRMDEDIIQEVEVLRQKKRRVKKVDSMKSIWLRIGAVAACICLVVGGAAAWRLMSVPEKENAEGLVSAPEKEDTAGLVVSEAGITIPPMQVTLSSAVEADMIGFFIYENRCYVQYQHIYEDTDIVGEYLGTATGLIDEWTPKEGYVNFAGSVRGDFYSVKGYDPEFMLCTKDARGVVSTYICNNGITLKYGKELYEDRLHLSEYITGVQYESRESWYEGLGEMYELGKADDTIQEFIQQINQAEFVFSTDVATREGLSHMVDSEIYHMYFNMKDGTTIHLRLHENGYVRFQGLWDVCVKVPAEIYNELITLFDERTGTPVEGARDSLEISYEDCVADPELGSFLPSYIPAGVKLERADIYYYLEQSTGKETGTKEISLYYVDQQNADRSYTITVTWADEYGNNGWAGPMVEPEELNLETIAEYSITADPQKVSSARYPKTDFGLWLDEVSVVISARGIDSEVVLQIMESVQ